MAYGLSEDKETFLRLHVKKIFYRVIPENRTITETERTIVERVVDRLCKFFIQWMKQTCEHCEYKHECIKNRNERLK